jgi:two-component system response regulator AtoC
MGEGVRPAVAAGEGGLPGATSSQPASFGDEAGAVAGSLNLRRLLGEREKQILTEALRRAGGVRKEAARLLGIDQRNLAYYLRKHGLDPDEISR